MINVEQELEKVVLHVAPLLAAFQEPAVSEPPAPGKWSAKQVLGHLIDSAANNHHRFVRAQFSSDLIFPGYEQEAWVAVQRYQDASWSELVAFWRSYNLHLARVIAAIPSPIRLAVRERHNLHRLAWQPVPEDEPTTLEYFMGDYLGHLNHHVAQMFRALGLPSTPAP